MPSSRLPAELVLVIMDYATYERDVFHIGAPSHFAYPPSRSYRESSLAVRATMPTKLALVAVCKAWRALAEPYLYAAVVISRLDRLRRLSEALCQERGAPPGSPVCFAHNNSVSARARAALEHRATRGWWTRRLDFAVTSVPQVADDCIDLDDAASATGVLYLSLIFRSCCNLKIVVNLTRPPHWFNLICVKAALNLNRASISVISHDISFPPYNPNRVQRFLRQAKHLSVMDCSLEFATSVVESSSDESEDTVADEHSVMSSPALQVLRVPLNDTHTAYFTSADFPALRHISVGAINFRDDPTYFARFLRRHSTITSVEFLLSTDQISWNIVLSSPLLLTDVIFDIAHHARFRWAPSVPDTILRLGVRFRRMQASRIEHELLFYHIGRFFPNVRVVRLLHPKHVSDLAKLHTKYISRWISPLLERGVRVEGPEGDLFL